MEYNDIFLEKIYKNISNMYEEIDNITREIDIIKRTVNDPKTIGSEIANQRDMRQHYRNDIHSLYIALYDMNLLSQFISKHGDFNGRIICWLKDYNRRY